LAKTLAASCSQGTPLTQRFTAAGELVVIAADGRKLWFSAVEVSRARRALLEEAKLREKAQAANRPRTPVRLAPTHQPGAETQGKEVNKP
jgi:hypothetical protein